MYCFRHKVAVHFLAPFHPYKFLANVVPFHCCHNVFFNEFTLDVRAVDCSLTSFSMTSRKLVICTCKFDHMHM